MSSLLYASLATVGVGALFAVRPSRESDSALCRVRRGVRDDTYALYRALFCGRSVAPYRPLRRVGSGKSVFEDGFSEVERAKAVAIEQYDRVNRRYNELVKQGKDAAADTLEQVRRELEDKRSKLEEVSRKFEEFGGGDINSVVDEQVGAAKQTAKKWWDRGKQAAEPAVDSAVAKGLQGWGDTAADFAREEAAESAEHVKRAASGAADTVKQAAGSVGSALQPATDTKPSSELEQLKRISKKGWFSSTEELNPEVTKSSWKGLEGWGDTAAEFAREEYEDAKKTRK
ncbi:Om45p KNAG_0E01700 [Huiozyma naganishii CBS 8797]|uniref:Uncharacterized protein n=1 Tax=Huiozyma naganishii (strain ATCC MYA-139 / BCRC 22969 / CBS 8797 / KCTC 17520 / NBRC 10181 / NCYC 3082 / Yp74L-3) TaxID=1071383 RepID=J7RZ11_HUIN7|nr:hypothetical protein KNAG_0E01700 [Kazachstania naganishii CBS 8797]CCK70432.1 hypothetical protein KNAG_0E01700 [Kazachstania naganishii CBS 8797]